jgi:hypothetical protein
MIVKKIKKASYRELINIKAAKINRFLSAPELISQIMGIIYIRESKTKDRELLQKYSRNRELLNSMKKDLG